MSFYSWVPRGREIEERVLVGIFFLAFVGIVYIIIGLFKWVVSLF